MVTYKNIVSSWLASWKVSYLQILLLKSNSVRFTTSCVEVVHSNSLKSSLSHLTVTGFTLWWGRTENLWWAWKTKLPATSDLYHNSNMQKNFFCSKVSRKTNEKYFENDTTKGSVWRENTMALKNAPISNWQPVKQTLRLIKTTPL